MSADNSRATGVLLADGTTLPADVVVLNADLVHAYSALLPESPAAAALQSRASSCSSISLYWALSDTAPGLDTHNIFLADEYAESFDAIFKAHALPRRPSFYVNVPSRIDASAAPPGRDALVVLVPCGHLSPAAPDWAAAVARVRAHVLAVIAARTGEDLRGRIVHEAVNTPPVWRDRFNLHQGAILGLSHNIM